MKTDWKSHLETAVQAAKAAGKIQLEHYQKIDRITYKGEVNLLTHVDLACEKTIKDIIRAQYPGHEILAEESDLEKKDGSPFRWIVDPLDGTTNYAHGYPLFASSIALVHEGAAVAGVVFNPLLNELFSATKGGGAFLNGAPIKVSGVQLAREALFTTGFAYDRRERIDHYLSIFRDFKRLGHGVRRGGAASVDLCYLACGRVDGYWEEKLKPWDVAAGSLLVTEAGGKVTNFDGSPLDLYGENLCASNGRIHEEMLCLLKPFIPNR
ncbi:MAG: inositol monophosphatase family protein [Bdellovibrionota bacterium]